MNKINSLVSILLLIEVYPFNCQVNQRNVLYEYLSTILVVNENDVYLEAYDSKENKEILNENNPQKYRDLKWFSIGYPIIIENKNKSMLHFTEKGFYLSIQMLTNEQKGKIIDEISSVYNISIETNQIIELKPNKFECELKLNRDTKEGLTFLQGKIEF